MATLVPRRFARNIPVSPPVDWMERIFNDLIPSRLMGLMPSWREPGEFLPAFDISETDSHIIVKGDLPGIDPNKLDISLTGNQLTIRGERDEEHEKEGESFHSVERRFGSFSRSFILPADVKEEGIDATFKEGVLTVSIPKTDVHRQRKIEVKSQ